MKKIMMMMLMVIPMISQTASALTGKDRWQDIRTNPEVLIQHPTFAKAFGPQGLFNACVTEDEFRTIKPVTTCLSYKEVIRNNQREFECAENETRHVQISRTYNQNICLRHAPATADSSGECLEYGNSTSVYPTSFKLAVIEGVGSEYGNLIFSKSYAVPTCE